MKKQQPKKKVVKAWAVVSSKGVLWQFLDGTYDAWFNAIGNQKMDAAKFIKVESIGESDQCIVPCEIHYTPPKSNKKPLQAQQTKE